MFAIGRGTHLRDVHAGMSEDERKSRPIGIPHVSQGIARIGEDTRAIRMPRESTHKETRRADGNALMHWIDRLNAERSVVSQHAHAMTFRSPAHVRHGSRIAENRRRCPIFDVPDPHRMILRCRGDMQSVGAPIGKRHFRIVTAEYLDVLAIVDVRDGDGCVAWIRDDHTFARGIEFEDHHAEFRNWMVAVE